MLPVSFLSDFPVPLMTGTEAMSFVAAQSQATLWFFAEWAATDRMMKWEITAIDQGLRSAAGLVGVDLDRPDSQLISERFHIRSPTTLIAFNGGQEQRRRTGLASASVLTAWLREAGIAM